MGIGGVEASGNQGFEATGASAKWRPGLLASVNSYENSSKNRKGRQMRFLGEFCVGVINDEKIQHRFLYFSVI
jgi:hypothetical protein